MIFVNKTDCDIIKDLLPLYVDDVSSDKSKSLVEAHINHCDSCANELRIMKESLDIELVNKTTEVNQGISMMEKIKKSIIKKNIKLVIISTICVTIIFAGFGAYFFGYKTPIAYEDISMHIEEFGPERNLIFSGLDFNRYSYTEEIISEDENTIHRAITISIYKTPFTKIQNKQVNGKMMEDFSDYVIHPEEDYGPYIEQVEVKKIIKTTEIYYSEGEGAERHLVWSANN